jgi:hypothetical protein
MHLKTNTYYCSCWKTFFPSTPIPDTDEQYMKSVIDAAEKKYLDHCSFQNDALRRPSFHAITLDDVNNLIEHHKKMEEFSSNFHTFIKELFTDRISKKDWKKLRLLSTRLTSAVKKLKFKLNQLEKAVEQCKKSKNSNSCSKEKKAIPIKHFVIHGVLCDLGLN